MPHSLRYDYIILFFKEVYEGGNKQVIKAFE
jgi:hypothetical protein